MGMGSDNSGYGDFILLSFVAESRKRPSTAACVCGSKSANPPSPPRNSLAHVMACFASLSVIDSCAEVLSLVYPMAIESCVPRLSQELNMFNGILGSGCSSEQGAAFLDAHGLYSASISTDSV